MDFNALGVQDWAELQGLAFMMLLATLINPKFPGVICNYINRYASSSDKVFGNEL